VPRSLTVDNGKQFDSDNFKSFYKRIGTKIAFASVYHPESNGAMERANRIVFNAISKTLFNLHKGKWIEELPKVVWSHNTMVSRTIGFTPFNILYGEEAMLPEEIKHQSLHTIRHAMAEDEEYSKETIESTRLEALKLRHSLRDISKIEYEHYSTSDSGHKEDSRSCKQIKRREQEQAKALLDA
jgi:hypothetical protein